MYQGRVAACLRWERKRVKEGDCLKDRFRRCRFGIITAVVLVLFTTYALLDVFVIPRTYSVVDDSGRKNQTTVTVTPGAAEGSVTPGENATPTGLVITDNSYRDENISVEIREYRVKDTNVYVADVQLSSPEYLRSAFAQSAYGRNVTDTTSAIAADVNAILAINGDFYGARNTGFVVRNGVIYRRMKSDEEGLAMYEDGHFEVIDESSVSADRLVKDGAVQVWSFGPGLVKDGKIAVTTGEEVGRALESNPRTAIAYVGENHYMFVVADGRTSENDGLSLYELAEFLESLGVQTAYNLDGGGSSTMVFLGKVVNNPTTGGRKIKERSVSDIVYIGY